MKKYLDLVKFSHTVFALPFALVGFTLGMIAVEYRFEWRSFLGVVGCMVFARSAAMAFNRYLDRDIDKLNPRTAVREIPAGAIEPRAALIFTLVNAVLFIATCWIINPLCFYLSPIALLITLGYSYTKRFTFLCHVVLGLGLALAPVGAYIAVTAEFSLESIIYGIGVLTWVSGFDIIYALQDDAFDRDHGLHSMPADFGRDRALMFSKSLHIITALAFVVNGYLLYHQSGVAWLVILATLTFIISLIIQHRLVSKDDLSRVDQAFFMTNGISSVLYGILIIASILI